MTRRFSFLRSKLAVISGDFALSILASIIYTFSRQIVVFPLLAARLSEADYGTVLTVIGLVNVFVALVGGTLNNIRLIKDTDYADRDKKGDFLLLCIWGSVLGAAACVVVGYLFSLSAVTTITLIGYLVVSNFYHYAVAYFRLELNFKRNMTVNILVSAGYILCCFLFADAQLWPLIFLFGEAVGVIYTAITAKFYRETLKKSPLFGSTAKAYLQLAFVNLASNLLMYADRIIIHPFLGPESVSYYSTASFFGKSAGIVMTPIAGVLLGYFSQKNFAASKKLFLLVNGLSLGCLVLFQLFCWLCAPWFTHLLYPTLYQQSLPYIFLANLGAVVNIAGNMAQPMILKACPTKYLIAIQMVYGAAYVLLSVCLLPVHGLMGFCVATILANLVRLLALYGLGLWKL